MTKEIINGEVTMHWSYPKSDEIEIVMRMETYSWVGVGWKSTSATTACKVFDPVLEVEKKHKKALEDLVKRQASYTTKAVSACSC